MRKFITKFTAFVLTMMLAAAMAVVSVSAAEATPDSVDVYRCELLNNETLERCYAEMTENDMGEYVGVTEDVARGTYTVAIGKNGENVAQENAVDLNGTVQVVYNPTTGALTVNSDQDADSGIRCELFNTSTSERVYVDLSAYPYEDNVYNGYIDNVTPGTYSITVANVDGETLVNGMITAINGTEAVDVMVYYNSEKGTVEVKTIGDVDTSSKYRCELLNTATLQRSYSDMSVYSYEYETYVCEFEDVAPGEYTITVGTTEGGVAEDKYTVTTENNAYLIVVYNASTGKIGVNAVDKAEIEKDRNASTVDTPASGAGSSTADTAAGSGTATADSSAVKTGEVPTALVITITVLALAAAGVCVFKKRFQ